MDRLFAEVQYEYRVQSRYYLVHNIQLLIVRRCFKLGSRSYFCILYFSSDAFDFQKSVVLAAAIAIATTTDGFDVLARSETLSSEHRQPQSLRSPPYN
jgi:hypothetical protein